MPRNRKRVLLILLFLLVASLAGSFAIPIIRRQQQASSPRQETNRLVRGSITATVGAAGNAHARQTTTLFWQTTGTVASVSVKPGDHVQAGQALAALDPASLPPAVLQAQSDLINAEKALENLRQSQVALAKAQVSTANAQKALDDAIEAQQRLKLPNASPSNIELAQGNYDQAQAQLDQAKRLYSLFEGRPQEDVQRLQAAAAVDRAKRFLTYAEINLEYARNKPDAQTAARVNASVEVATAQLQDAQREVKRLKNGPSEDDITVAQARIDAARAALALGQLSAPIQGSVTLVSTMPGDAVRPGKAAIRIEDLTEMHVNVQVPEVDINRIQVNQPASLTFDALPGQQFTGEVREVSGFGAPSQGNISFTVEIRLDNANETVKPGMTAAVNITVAQANNVLLVPNRAVRFINGQRTVYAVRGSQVVSVPVDLGITDEENSQLLSGNLQEGDVILLNPPDPTPAK